MLGLYLHIPFCSAICNYCNFNRGLFDADVKARYVEALLGEIRGAGGAGSPDPADTIYFGGGTPSLLSADDVRRIVEACRASFAIPSDVEVTLEANPESVSTSLLAAFRAAGVNRLSFGVQSLRDDELKRLTRLHGAARARAALAEARDAGFDNVSLDLMMWLPGQSPLQWLESVDGAIALAPEHLSLYMLEVYPNAPLKDDMARARWSQAPDEDVETMYLTAMERLASAGLEQYEISNVARQGRQSRHNVKYWIDGEWLGFGCGAHSTRDGVRWKNIASTDEYIARIGRGASVRAEARRLTAAERLGDALFTGLRLTQGLDLEAIGRRYDCDVWARFGADLQPFVDAGILDHDHATLRLTRRGMLLANEVMAVFV
ncbi:MAG TPA: radical SAM family heme chaperone HemW [Vicinamibacterales bacterium]|nr:radical SAM family heme chaperone HemW [Vicinamibacterales bacterium]